MIAGLISTVWIFACCLFDLDNESEHLLVFVWLVRGVLLSWESSFGSVSISLRTTGK